MLKASQRLLVRNQVLVQKFNCDNAVHITMASLVNYAHATFTEHADDFVFVGEYLADH